MNDIITTFNGGISDIRGPDRQLPSYSLWDLLTATADENNQNTALVALHQPFEHLSFLFSKAHTSIPQPQRSDDANATQEVHQFKDCFSCTYAQLHTAVQRVAISLFSQGIRKGDHITVFTWNCVEWVLLFWASAWLGTVIVNLDPAMLTRPDDLSYHLDLLKPKVLIAGDEASARAVVQLKEVKAAVNAVSVKLYLHETESLSNKAIDAHDFQSFESYITSSPDSLSTEAWTEIRETNIPDPDDAALIGFTSGTTSRPKGCTWTSTFIVSVAKQFINQAALDSTSKFVLHTTCFRAICWAWTTPTWAAGGTVVMPSAKFDTKTSLAAISKTEATHMVCVPSMISAFSEDPELERYDRRSMKVVLLSGDIIFSAVLEKTRQLFSPAWVTPLYGQTEGIGYIQWYEGDKFPILPSNVVALGRVTPGSGIRVCEPGTRDVIAIGEFGVLHVSSVGTISSYLLGRDAESFYNESGRAWFITGDRAMIDESGALFVTGRYKDTIKVNSVNFSPAVIEGSLQKVDGVTAQVVSIPDDVHGSLPVAVINSRVHVLSEELKQEMRRTVEQDVGPDAHFQHIFSLEELGLDAFPLNDSGKVIKRDLVRLLS